MSNTEFVMAPLELLKRVAIGYPQAEVLALGRSAAIVELGEFLCRATTQHQGEPVGEVADMKYNRVQFYRETGDTSKPYLLPGTKLYTHADPAEVGEIKKQNAELVGEVVTLTAEVERLRAELVEWKERCQGNNHEAMTWMSKHDTLRAQLAEQNSLLREVLEAFKLETDGSCINPGRDFIRPWAAKLAALSASAEPSASVERDELKPCPFCGCQVTLLTGREDHRISGAHAKLCPFRDIDVIVDSREAWQGRAALERKP